MSCGSCGKTAAKSHCARCKSAFYCDAECQAHDWPKHSSRCVIAATKGVLKYPLASSTLLIRIVDGACVAVGGGDRITITRYEESATATGGPELHLDTGEVLTGLYTVSRFLAIRGSVVLVGGEVDSRAHTEISMWCEDFAAAFAAGRDKEAIQESMLKLSGVFASRTFLVNDFLTLADFSLLEHISRLDNYRIFNSLQHTKKGQLNDLLRWYNTVMALPYVDAAVNAKKHLKAQSEQAKKEEMGSQSVSGDTGGSFDIHLPNAEMGKVCTRFPPEPSGYLHIGHAKAALLNNFYARQYKGKLILRFDDTNPAKEKQEYVDNILRDLETMKIKPDMISYSSDYFDRLLDMAKEFIKNDKAYVDDITMEQMREWRMEMKESPCRSNSVARNLQLFQEMIDGSEVGKKCTLRAKIDMKSKNGTMRDPVLYRCLDQEHHATGRRFKLYPTYDFVMPIIDAWEGVTHALRSNEYHDRNEQYYWVASAAGLKSAFVEDFSRINFVYTLLSKRKLTALVDSGAADGWNDPRFPTIQGLLRRGLCMDAIKEYIMIQGLSKREVLLEWEKLWVINRRILDPTTPRLSAVSMSNKYLVTIAGASAATEAKTILKNKKNPELGKKVVLFSNRVYVDGIDAAECKVNEEVTLMDWGNIVITEINTAERTMAANLHLAGDFKKTEKKLQWVANVPEAATATLCDFSYLINKKKLEDDDDPDDFMNPVTKTETTYFCDANIRTLKKDDIIQLERVAYCRVDQPYVSATRPAVLFIFPDGKKIPDPPPPVPRAAKPAAPATAAAPATSKMTKQHLEAEVAKQGEVVKKLKAEKAAKDKIQNAVDKLNSLSKELETVAGSAAAASPAPAPTAAATGGGRREKAVVDAEVSKQGDLVRKLKADKASKDKIDEAVLLLKALKSEQESLAGAGVADAEGGKVKSKPEPLDLFPEVK